MTAKEKAKELVENIRLNVLDYEGCSINEHKAKQCAKIAVEEILKSFGLRANGQEFYTEYRAVEFYQNVLNEIDNL